jgi:hypothetical protein
MHGKRAPQGSAARGHAPEHLVKRVPRASRPGAGLRRAEDRTPVTKRRPHDEAEPQDA